MKSRIHVQHGDITQLTVDVIVNAANASLLGAVALTARFIVQRVRRYWKPAKSQAAAGRVPGRTCGHYSGRQSAGESGDPYGGARLAWRRSQRIPAPGGCLFQQFATGAGQWLPVCRVSGDQHRCLRLPTPRRSRDRGQYGCGFSCPPRAT